MVQVGAEVGRQIRRIRKMRGMTLAELSEAVCKSKSTLSKYEAGEISVDVQTLYELAGALRVPVEQLLYRLPEREAPPSAGESPAFFSGVRRFYADLFDGRSGQLIRCVFEVLSREEGERSRVVLYMNFRDYESCEDCENTYRGYIEHYDALTDMRLTNQDTPMEKASVQILASFLDSDTKWGLWCGLSSRPMMPIAAKMLFSREQLKEDEELLRRLKISREDIRLLRLYNMFPVI